jgi:hypothetical protein
MKDNPGYLVLLDFYEESQSIRTRFYCPPGFRVLDALNELIIRKETVQFVTADDRDAGRGFGLSPDRNHYRVIEKLPVLVDLQIKAYRLMGKMHQIRKGKLEDTMADYVYFLPLTDVTIMRDLKVIAEKPFTAVNKKYILSINEADAQDVKVTEQAN